MKIRYVLALSVTVLLFGVVGNADYEDALAEEAFYIEMVCEGKWPDYKNLEPSCVEDRS